MNLKKDKIKFGMVEILKITIRSFLVRLFYNYKYMFGQGLCYCMITFLKKVRKSNNSNEEIDSFFKRHLQFFNANEYLIGYAIGIILNLEEQKDFNKLARVKTVIKSSLGALGDDLFYNKLYPIFYMIIAVNLVYYGFEDNRYLAIMIFSYLILFNILNFGIRFLGIYLGYKKGIKALSFYKTRNYQFISLFLSTVKHGLFFFLFLLVSVRYENSFSLTISSLSLFFLIGLFFIYNKVPFKKSLSEDFYIFIVCFLFLLMIYCFF